LLKERKHPNKETHQRLLHASESVLSVQRLLSLQCNSKTITQVTPLAFQLWYDAVTLTKRTKAAVLKGGQGC
jgi:hypothetical protein